MLGFKQSLTTPSCRHGVRTLLKRIEKTLQLYSTSFSMSTTAEGTTGASGKSMPTKKQIIEKKLAEALAPALLEVEDVSYQHAGHAGAPKGSSETHFNVKVVSEQFQGRNLLKRHRLVYDLLRDELQEGGVHALSLNTKTPAEVGPKP
ncbi:uncharacterized protein [Physcomitrium patens]|uniref:Bola-like protein n=1 Tax=Physcomitrium patens TaxID=3218 RepID=A0A2K1IYA5_PHYPA|nr:hypothetical protein PHYPA_024072 [Physcomitrium patens]